MGNHTFATSPVVNTGVFLTLPTADGSSGQVVTTNGSGVLSFANGSVPDDAITLAKMAPGTDGNIISYDTSGNPVAVATGNDGQVLTSAGAGAVPTFETLPAGTTLSGSTNNTVATVTGANALIGEATLTYDATTLSIIPTGTQSNLRLQNSTTGSGGTDGFLIQATGNDVYINNYENADMYFRTNNTDRLKLHENGVLSASAGVALGVGTANTASNVLDDYEEGTFTPTFVNQSGAEASNYTNNSTGSYIKIGKMVYANVSWNMGTISTGPGSLYAGIGGFPFVSDVSAGGCPWYTNIDVPDGPATFQISNNYNYGIFYSQRDNNNYNTISPDAIASNDNFQITFVYKTD